MILALAGLVTGIVHVLSRPDQLADPFQVGSNKSRVKGRTPRRWQA